MTDGGIVEELQQPGGGLDPRWDELLAAWLRWCDQVDSYDFVAGSPRDLARVLRPAREDYERGGIVPDWCGPHLLAAWLYYLYRADRAGGGYSLQRRDQPAASELAAVAAALVTTPPWSQPPPYPRPLIARGFAASVPAGQVQLGSVAAELQLELVTRTVPGKGVEEYLYSPDKLYRYAFARWWGTPDLATVTTWVLLNPATVLLPLLLLLRQPAPTTA